MNVMELLASNEERLTALVVRAAEKAVRDNCGYGVVCINVDDEVFQPLVLYLMGDHDWDQYRRLGQVPVARGVVPTEFLREVLTTYAPDLMAAFDKESIPVLGFSGGQVALAGPPPPPI